MVKKSLSLVLAVCMLFSLCLGISAAEEAQGDKVEISFALGDKVLMINGEAVESECAPYTVGEGVTLVPVRIITEAFGAEVGWDETTETVTLKYQDVTIELVIGNSTALVNGNQVALLAPPELNEGRTMVPLRFISENFGAEVGWDPSADRITIVKEASGGDGPITDIEDILNHSKKERVGDSYFNWSIQRVPDMRLAYKQTDGFNTVFTSESKNMELYVLIYDLTETTDEVSEIKQIIKKNAEGYTQISMEEKKLGSVPYVQAQYKDKDLYADDRVYLTGKYVINVLTFVPSDQNASVFNAAVEVADTFNFTFDEKTTEDLSEIGEDGTFLFADAKMGVLMQLPAGWRAFGSEDIDNEFRFSCVQDKKTVGSGQMSIYSKSSVGSAEEYAKSDRGVLLAEYNSEYTTCTDVTKAQINGLTAYTYSYTFKYQTLVNTTTTRIFLENGDYVYMVSIQADNGSLNNTARNKILDSFVCVQLDPNVVGKLSRHERNIEEMQVVKNTQGQFWFELPSFYDTEQKNGSTHAFDPGVGREILASMQTISGMPANATLNLNALARDLLEELRTNKNVISVDYTIKNVATGKGIQGVSFNYIQKITGSTLPYKMTEFIFSYKNEVYLLTVASPILASDSVNEKAVIDHIIETFDFEK